MKEEKLSFEKVWLMFQETDKKINKLAIESDKTEKQIKNLGKEIGNLGNSFGRYTEGMLGPSIRKILNKLGAESAYANFTDPKKNKFEFDYVGTVNGSINKVFLVEVKTTLSEEHIKKFIEKLKIVSNEVSDFKGKKVIGAIASISYLEKDREIVLSNGLYFMNISNDIAKLDTPKSFVPKEF
ncbi:MAG: hypothetical protein NTW25_09200 [Candidatus Kapabacteria bacterium]|nr:hypothetical protein [Candidatus Kapabacteria bacterium]